MPLGEAAEAGPIVRVLSDTLEPVALTVGVNQWDIVGIVFQ